MCELYNNHTHQGESEPELDLRLRRSFQLQQDFEHARGRRRMYQPSGRLPEWVQKESDRRDSY